MEQRVKSCRCRLHSDYRDFVSHSYIVPRASHPAVAGDACLGRVLTAERKVISRNSRITVEIATSCRTSELSEALHPLATVVICGLITSTLLTLLILPTLYGWFEREQDGEREK